MESGGAGENRKEKVTEGGNEEGRNLILKEKKGSWKKEIRGGNDKSKRDRCEPGVRTPLKGERGLRRLPMKGQVGCREQKAWGCDNRREKRGTHAEAVENAK